MNFLGEISIGEPPNDITGSAAEQLSLSERTFVFLALVNFAKKAAQNRIFKFVLSFILISGTIHFHENSKFNVRFAFDGNSSGVRKFCLSWFIKRERQISVVK